MGEPTLSANTVRNVINANPAEAQALMALLSADPVLARAVGYNPKDSLESNRMRLLESQGLLEAAYVPGVDLARDLARPRAEQGIAVNRDANLIETADGYRFSLGDNRVAIDWPGRTNDGAPETLIQGRNVNEGDGTTWKAENGNYILPNGAMFTLAYDGDRIAGLTLVHGDSKVNANLNGNPQIGAVTGGGYDYRNQAVEKNVDRNTYRMGGFNDKVDDLDVTWNLERGGRNVGRMGSGDTVDANAGYTVDPELKPPFGSQDYERMLRSEIEDLYATLSGQMQSAGVDTASARDASSSALSASGLYDQYAQALQQSQGARGDTFGGMTSYYPQLDAAMAALNQLQQVVQANSGMQQGVTSGVNPGRSFLPNYAGQNQQVSPQDAALLIDRVLRGVNQNGNGSSVNANAKVERFRNDQRAAFLQNRIASQNITRNDAGVGSRDIGELANRAAELRDKLSYSAGDWAVTDGDAKDVISELSKLNNADLKTMVDAIGPERMMRLQDNLSDADKQTYASTLDQLNAFRDNPGIRSEGDPAGLGAQLKDKLNGAYVSDEDASFVLNKLSRLGEGDLKQVTEAIGPEHMKYLLDNVADVDKETYKSTLARITKADPNSVADEMSDKLRTGWNEVNPFTSKFWDLAVTDGDARDVISKMSNLSNDDLRKVAAKIGPEKLHTLIDEMSDEDKAKYATTIDRLAGVVNAPVREVRDNQKTYDQVKDDLSYGAFDWSVTDGNARSAASNLAGLTDQDLKWMIGKLKADGIDAGDRIGGNLSDADKRLYAPLLERISRLK